MPYGTVEVTHTSEDILDILLSDDLGAAAAPAASRSGSPRPADQAPCTGESSVSHATWDVSAFSAPVRRLMLAVPAIIPVGRWEACLMLPGVYASAKAILHSCLMHAMDHVWCSEAWTAFDVCCLQACRTALLTRLKTVRTF